MRLAGLNDTDIKLDQNGQPVVDSDGECVICSDRSCRMQDIWIELLTEESELLWEDQEGTMAYGLGLTDYLHVELDEAFEADFRSRVISKLAKRNYIDDGSIQLSMEVAGDGTWNSHISFQEVDGDSIDIDIGTDGKEIYVT